jgi:serine protease Do
MKFWHRILLVAAAGPLLCPGRIRAVEAPDLDLARRLNTVFVETAARVIPSVVVVIVTEKAPASAADLEGDSPDPFDYLPREFSPHYRQPFPYDPPQRARASGVIFSNDGYLITNAHVVNNAGSIEVRLHDGRLFRADVRGLDVPSDIAVLKIAATNLPVATWADSSKVRVGEFAIAVGAPFTYDYSVTVGHVSAIGRSRVIQLPARGWGDDQEYLQTDANINPGNSGGPLMTIEGEVMGVVTLIRGLRTGIGFAVPSNLAREVAEALVAEGRFSRVSLGIGFRSLKEDAADAALFRNLDRGVVVVSVRADGPGARAGLHPTDVILAVDGAPVATALTFQSELRRKKPGQTLALDLWRAGATNRVMVTAGDAVEPKVSAPAAPALPRATSTGPGVKVQALSRELADRFGVASSEGVIVVEVERNSLTARKGIKPGDIITGVGRQVITTPAQFEKAMRETDFRQGVALILISGDVSRFEILRAEGE